LAIAIRPSAAEFISALARPYGPQIVGTGK
jgi:hypothetical protein